MRVLTTGSSYTEIPHSQGRFVDFEWDAAKDRSNQSKHAISFAEAVAVFVDSKLILLNATRREDNEDRLKAIGMIEEELIVVIFTMRESVTRVISARRANRKEERIYGYRKSEARS